MSGAHRFALIARYQNKSMETAVRVSNELVREAKIFSKIDQRSITGQIEHWAKIGKCAEENPDLTDSLINLLHESSLLDKSEKI